MRMSEAEYRQHLETVRQKNKEFYPRFSEEEYERRHNAIRKMMEKEEVDILLIFGDSGHCYMNMGNVRYVSNYADHQYSYIVMPREGALTQFISIPNIQPGAMAISIVDDVRWAVGTQREMGAEVAKRVKELAKPGRGSRVGIVGPDAYRMPSLPHHHYVTITGELPEAEFVVLTPEFETIRRVQSQEEIAWLKKGAEMTDKAMWAMVDIMEPGAREYELYGAQHCAYLPEGGNIMFSIISSTSMHESSMPHPAPWASTRPLKEGDIVVTEISASYHGYAGQLIRAVALGDPPDEYVELFELAKEIFHDTASILVPGATEQDVLEISRRIPEHGFNSLTPIVHGWNLGLCAPYIGVPGAEAWSSGHVEFQENMTVMIEPNISSVDLTRGITFGELSRVTKDGAVSYHEFPQEFIVK